MRSESENIKMETVPVESTDKEKEFLDIIFALESEKQSLIEESRTRLSLMRKDAEVNFFTFRNSKSRTSDKKD